MPYKLNNSNLFLSIDGELADSALANSEANIYLNTSSKDVMIKYRDDGGTLRTRLLGESNTYGSGQILFADVDGSITSSSTLTYDVVNERVKAGTPSSSIFAGSNNGIYSGNTNTITTGDNVFIGGGDNLTNTSGNNTALIGGLRNTVNANCAVVIGGNDNQVDSADGIIIASRTSTIPTGSAGSLIAATQNGSTSGTYSAVIGCNNVTVDRNHAVAFGCNASNITNGLRASIISGLNHVIGATSGGDDSSIIGGEANEIDVADHAFIGGGRDHTINGSFTNSGILGGNGNTVTANNAGILGGFENTVTGNTGVCLGGATNNSSGQGSAIVGGINSTASGDYSYAFGRYANAATSDSVIFNLDTTAAADVTTTVAESFCVLADGGAVFGSPTSVASAELAIESTTKGFRLPKMTTTQMNNIASPDEGLSVFDITTKQFMGYNGTNWVILG